MLDENLIFLVLQIYFRREFFHHRLEVVDMIIIIISFIITLTFEIISIRSHVRYGKYAAILFFLDLFDVLLNLSCAKNQYS